MVTLGHWINLLCLAAVCSCGSGQTYIFNREKINLCEKLPNVEPNGEHLPRPGNKIVAFTNWTNNRPTNAYRCLMRFSTCDYCRLRVHRNSSGRSRSCHPSVAYTTFMGWCASGCSYLHLFDQDYSNQTAMSYSSEAWLHDYITESRFLYVVACANQTRDTEIHFNITITSEDKTKVLRGSSWDYKPGEITSPFFPVPYVLNSEIYHFVFVASTQDEFVTISFDDWHLSSYSTVIFDDANVNGIIKGSAHRPWIISNKYRLKMTFETGPYKLPGTFRSYTGFKAKYKFHHSKDRGDIPYVVTSCGGRITSQETGNITFNPASNGMDYYDCIWVIQKPAGFEKIMVKVVNYSTRDTTYRVNQPNVLEIREGLTSEGDIQASDAPTQSPDDVQIYYPHSSDDGFYIRLKGRYSGRRDFVLTYTAFNLVQCRNMFLCRNYKCISRNLRCNGVDNCGDNTDELSSECGGNGSGSDRTSRYTLSVGIIIPMVVSIFLIVVVCLLVIFIRRCRRLSQQARCARRHHRQINTVSGAVSSRRRRNRRQGQQGGARGGSGDLPPSYEDVLSSTPIGYLNLGFADSSITSQTGLIQPPSYEEATSLTMLPAPFGQIGGHTDDLSSDSSLPETDHNSQRHLSTSYSSDDTQAGQAPGHTGTRRQHCRTMSSSSSDSSLGPNPLQQPVNGNRESGGGNRQGEECLGQANSRRSIAKPDEGGTELAVSTTSNLGIHKDSHQKPGETTQSPLGMRNKRNRSASPAVIMQELSPTLADANTRRREDGNQNQSDPATNTSNMELSCRVEASPVVLVPTSTSAASDLQPEHIWSSSRDNASPSMQLGADGVRYTKPAETREHHVRRDPRTHRPLGTPMKLLSRSMDDIRRQKEDSAERPELPLSAIRPFSMSMENVCGGRRHQVEWESESDQHAPGETDQCQVQQGQTRLPEQPGTDSSSRFPVQQQYQHEAAGVTTNRPRPVPRPRKLKEGQAPVADRREGSEREMHGPRSSHPAPRSTSPPGARGADHGSLVVQRVPQPRSQYNPRARMSPSETERSTRPAGESGTHRKDNGLYRTTYHESDSPRQYSDRDGSGRPSDTNRNVPPQRNDRHSFPQDGRAPAGAASGRLRQEHKTSVGHEAAGWRNPGEGRQGAQGSQSGQPHDGRSPFHARVNGKKPFSADGQARPPAPSLQYPDPAYQQLPRDQRGFSDGMQGHRGPNDWKPDAGYPRGYRPQSIDAENSSTAQSHGSHALPSSSFLSGDTRLGRGNPARHVGTYPAHQSQVKPSPAHQSQVRTSPAHQSQVRTSPAHRSQVGTPPSHQSPSHQSKMGTPPAPQSPVGASPPPAGLQLSPGRTVQGFGRDSSGLYTLQLAREEEDDVYV